MDVNLEPLLFSFFDDGSKAVAKIFTQQDPGQELPIVERGFIYLKTRQCASLCPFSQSR